MSEDKSIPTRSPKQVEWRSVKGYEGIYEVSNHGDVRRIAMGRGVSKTKERQRRPLADHPCGYLAITIQRDNKPRTFLVHRLVAEAFIGPLGRLEVNHRDGDKKNNQAANLEIVTRQQNIDHAVATGLVNNKGEKNTSARLTAGQVQEIRESYTPGGYRNGGKGYKALSKLYGVSWETIRSIVKGNTWQHV